jgi:hypothetical protein
MADGKVWGVVSLFLTTTVGAANLLVTQCVNTRVSTLAALVKVKNDAYLNQLQPLREQTREFLLFIGRAAAGAEKNNVDALANEHRVKLRMLVTSARPLVADDNLSQSTEALLTAIDNAADNVVSGQAAIRHDEDSQAVLDAWGTFQSDVFRVLEVSAVVQSVTRPRKLQRRPPSVPTERPQTKTGT